MVAPAQLTTHNTTVTLLNARCFNTRKTVVFEVTRKCVLRSWQYFHAKTNNDLSFRNIKYIFVCTNHSRKYIVLEYVSVLCRILQPRAVNIVQETHQSHSTHKLGRGGCRRLAAVLMKFCTFGIFTGNA